MAADGGLPRVSAVVEMGAGENNGETRGPAERPGVMDAVGSQFLTAALIAFQEKVTGEQFPCLGARAAYNSGSCLLRVYPALACPATTTALADDLYRFVGSDLATAGEFATFVAVFHEPQSVDEIAFEQLLWRQLQALADLDAPHHEWDQSARSDPADPKFSFSFGGHSLYVVGMHAQSSRIARHFPWPALVFNPHAQFERLRADGKWSRMQEIIRARDTELQGSINPMLSDFGESTEARQYSGRAVEEGWLPPFKVRTAPGGGTCPFHQ